MKFRVPYTQWIDVTIDDPKEVLHELCSYFFNRKDIDNLIIKDNCIYYEDDISVHGSPYYEYKKITDDPKKIEILKSLKNIFINL
jgi:hypothetical protein